MYASTTTTARPVAARARFDITLADQHACDLRRGLSAARHRIRRSRLGTRRRRVGVWSGKCCSAPAADDAYLPADYSHTGLVRPGDQRAVASAYCPDRREP